MRQVHGLVGLGKRSAELEAFVVGQQRAGDDVDLARYLLPTPPVPVRWRRPHSITYSEV
jgi:hypothetical protein